MGPYARSGEELQVSLGEGPSLEGLTHGGPVLVADLDAAHFQTPGPPRRDPGQDPGSPPPGSVKSRLGCP